MMFKVFVEKRMYAIGTVTVEGEDADDAIDLVEEQIDSGELQTTAVDWGEYEDFSFVTTGDVDLVDRNKQIKKG